MNFPTNCLNNPIKICDFPDTFKIKTTYQFKSDSNRDWQTPYINKLQIINDTKTDQFRAILYKLTPQILQIYQTDDFSNIDQTNKNNKNVTIQGQLSPIIAINNEENCLCCFIVLNDRQIYQIFPHPEKLEREMSNNITTLYVHDEILFIGDDAGEISYFDINTNEFSKIQKGFFGRLIGGIWSSPPIKEFSAFNDYLFVLTQDCSINCYNIQENLMKVASVQIDLKNHLPPSIFHIQVPKNPRQSQIYITVQLNETFYVYLFDSRNFTLITSFSHNSCSSYAIYGNLLYIASSSIHKINTFPDIAKSDSSVEYTSNLSVFSITNKKVNQISKWNGDEIMYNTFGTFSPKKSNVIKQFEDLNCIHQPISDIIFENGLPYYICENSIANGMPNFTFLGNNPELLQYAMDGLSLGGADVTPNDEFSRSHDFPNQQIIKLLADNLSNDKICNKLGLDSYPLSIRIKIIQQYYLRLFYYIVNILYSQSKQNILQIPNEIFKTFEEVALFAVDNESSRFRITNMILNSNDVQKKKKTVFSNSETFRKFIQVAVQNYDLKTILDAMSEMPFSTEFLYAFNKVIKMITSTEPQSKGMMKMFAEYDFGKKYPEYYSIISNILLQGSILHAKVGIAFFVQLKDYSQVGSCIYNILKQFEFDQKFVLKYFTLKELETMLNLLKSLIHTRSIYIRDPSSHELIFDYESNSNDVNSNPFFLIIESLIQGKNL